MAVGGLQREYRVHLPSGYDVNRPVSLVLDFHGYTGTAQGTEEYTGFSSQADEQGYAVVYPQGSAFTTDDGQRITSWNDLAGSASPGPEGPICSASAFAYPHPPECGEPTPCNWASCHDDVGFVAALLDHLEATVCVDLDRVYATGMSNGGMFVHRLGCDLPERFAAIAPVGGTLARGFNCAPGGSTPLSMMNIYGARDDYVSQKGVVSSDGYYYLGAGDVLAKWASPAAQDCDSTETPYPIAEAGVLGMTCVQHDNCATGAEVVHCEWDGGHDWPQDGTDNFGTRIIWEFFSNHSRDGYEPRPAREQRP
jgi:polyhydroxybutyrate depolymerase